MAHEIVAYTLRNVKFRLAFPGAMQARSIAASPTSVALLTADFVMNAVNALVYRARSQKMRRLRPSRPDYWLASKGEKPLCALGINERLTTRRRLSSSLSACASRTANSTFPATVSRQNQSARVSLSAPS